MILATGQGTRLRGAPFSDSHDLLKTLILRGHEVIDWLEYLGVPWGRDHEFGAGGYQTLIWENADDGGNVVRQRCRRSRAAARCRLAPRNAV